MVKSKKNIVLICTMAIVLVMSMIFMVSCNEEKQETGKYKVTFMLRENGNGDWKEISVAETDENGKVTLPDDPAVEGFVFRGWYKDEACKEKFEGKDVTADMKVYAFMAEKVVTVNIKDGKGKVTQIKDQPVAKLAELEKAEAEKAVAANLTFDGFYKNEDCTSKYDANSEVTVIYARYAAKVIYNNGYEDLKTELVNPGSKLKAAKGADIKKGYMDAEDIYYVNVKSEDFDFNTPITENTVITVIWKTPDLKFKLIEGTNNYLCTGIDYDKADATIVDSYRVFSIPGKVTIDGQIVNVVAAELSGIASNKAATKVIINEGVMYLADLNAALIESKIEEVVIPSTMKIIEDSFNNLPNLKGIKLPAGLEIIINCFWKDYDATMSDSVVNAGYDFEIVVPASVKNIVKVPANLKYENSDMFKNDGDFVFKYDAELGKVLISLTQNSVKNGCITIPEGVDAIQVGVFRAIEFDYLDLPTTFKKVGYNEEISNYDFYTGRTLTDLKAVSEPTSNPKESGMTVYGYAIVPDLYEHKYIMFRGQEFPADMNKYAFCDWQGGTLAMWDELEKVNVVFIGKIEAENPVEITVNVTNTMLGNTKEFLIEDLLSGSKLTKEDLLAKLELTEEALGFKFTVESINQFGSAFDFDAVIDCNQYIDLNYKFAATGFTTEKNEDGTLTVTGFDMNTAQNLNTNNDPELSTYLIAIPSELNGAKIVAIKASAFEGNKSIAKVYIANTVKVIGERAFKNTPNLEFVSVEQGSLAKIGDEAFQYAGAIKDENGNYVCNPDLAKYDHFVNDDTPIAQLRVIIPLENLGDGLAEGERALGINTFDSPAIRTFTPVDQEKERFVIAAMNFGKDYTQLKEGEYYFHLENWDGENFEVNGIFKYVGKTTLEDTVKGNEPREVTIYDCEHYATAAGSSVSGSAWSFGYKAFDSDWQETVFFRFAIMEGSVQIYESGKNEITFALVSKVEKNAFTYVNEKYTSVHEDMNGNPYTLVTYMNPDYHSIYNTAEQLHTQDSNIFEEGWLCGRANSENKFMAQAEEHSGSYPGM